MWLTFDPQTRYEQAGRRPAVVVSPKTYNGKVGLAVFCPVTKQVKGYPFEVLIPEGPEVEGVVLSDQVKNLDWQARRAEYVCKLPRQAIIAVIQKLNTLLAETR